jgi:hypothetical protein
VKDKANKGWIKEISKPKQTNSKKPFNYSKPVSRVDKPNNMAVNARSREYKAVKPDKDSNFAVEQLQAKETHKGNK